MFKPLEMKRIRVLLLDKYLDRVMDAIGQKGAIQMTKVEGGDTATPERKKTLDGYSYVTNRIQRLKETLNVQHKRIEKVPLPKKSTEEYLREIEKTIEGIEAEAVPTSEKLSNLGDERKKLQDDIGALEELERLNIEAKWLGTTDLLYATSGFLDIKDLKELKSRINKATDGDFIVFADKEEGKEKTLIVIATIKGGKEAVDGILQDLKFEPFEVAGKDIKEARERLKSIDEEKKKLQEDLNKIREKYSEDILVAEEIAQIEKSRQEAVLNFGRSERVYVLEGWIPTKEIKKITEVIDDISKGCCEVKIFEPESYDEIPVSLDNPKLIKPFEVIMDMFGMPLYTEIDPTPILAITFPLFFGLMFGDVGHGAVIALLGLGIIRMKKGEESAWKFGMLLAYCGTAAVIFGFLYGSLFGNEEILSHLYKGWNIGHPVPAGHEELWVLWMSPPNEVMSMIGITLFIGALHMGLGLIASTINNIRWKGKGVLLPSIAKLWFFLGEVAIITVAFTFPIPFFNKLPEIMPMEIIVILGVGVPAAVILLVELTHVLHHFSITNLLTTIGNGLFEIFEMFSMFLSNTISYSRLLILAVVHAMMMVAIYSIAGMELLSGLIIVAPLIIIFGNILVIGLEGLVVFIHTIRLHFYEWFTKFYQSGGIPYTPFIVRRRYTTLTD
ncbi:MAG: V-type ATP synthase subunit I [Candidatus Altiarchaeota archaeon]|nr:V-type ATP synthase subunit I [Candidatus Altiarchaeota archaeon]